MNNSVAVLIRTWSNNSAIAKAVTRALGSGAGHVIVVVKDDDKAHEGSVEAWLAGTIKANPGRITILSMWEGYTWSSALNYGFDEVRRINLLASRNGGSRIEFVLNASNEALYEKDDLEAMVSMMSADEKIGAVGTTFRGVQNGNDIELGKSYVHPRNTLMLVRVAAYLAVGGYSPRCDQMGGQEDLEWLIRLRQMGHRWESVDRKVKLLVGVNFNQASKEARELKAIASIMRMNAEVTAGFAELVEGLQ